MNRFACRPGPRPLAGSRLLSSVLLPLLLASCGGGDSVAGRFEAPTWTLGPADLRIGGPVTGDASLPFVEAVEEGPDGRLYSLHARETFVRSWTEDGRAVGRPASGATFPDPMALGFFGDTLWVVDGQTYRVGLFGPDGTERGVLEPGVADDVSARRLPPRPREPLRDGALLGVTPEVSDAVARGRQPPTAWVTMEAGGTVRDTVWTRTWLARDVVALRQDGGGLYVRPPFDDGPLAETAAGGALVVVDRRVGEQPGTPTFAVTWIDMTGDTLARTEWTYEPRAVPSTRVAGAVSELADLWSDFLAETGDAPGADELAATVRDAVPLPPHEPPVADLVVGADGSAWLRRPSGERGRTEWWVVGPEGTPRARVEAPSELRILWAGPDHVLGSIVDSAGAHVIVRHPLLRR